MPNRSRRNYVVIATALASLISSCLPTAPKDSRVKVANGIDAAETDFPAVTRVSSGSSPKAGSYSSCTATAVSANTLLTAAHCLVDDSGQIERSVWIVDDSGEQVVANRKAVVLHPRYNNKGGTMEGNFDIAVVSFNEDVFKYWVGVSAVSGDIPDKITLVGFGITRAGGNDAGKKRYGTNTIRAVSGKSNKNGSRHASDTIVLEDGVRDAKDADSKGVDRGERVTNLQGDSGGPIFLKGSLLGVASTVGGIGSKVLNGSYISAHYHRDWLKGLKFPICGITQQCENLPKTDLEVKNQKATPKEPPSEPTPPKETDSYQVFAAVDGDVEPSLLINTTLKVDAVDVCLGATRELSESCSVKKTPFSEGSYFKVELGSQGQKIFVSIQTTKSSVRKKQLIVLERKS